MGILPEEGGDSGRTATALEPKCSGAAEALECNFGLWDQEDGSLVITLSDGGEQQQASSR